jgi:hypothetical protein
MLVRVAVPRHARGLVWLLPGGLLTGWRRPHSRVVYRPDPEGLMLVQPDHVPELLRQGCRLAQPLMGPLPGGF